MRDSRDLVSGWGDTHLKAIVAVDHRWAIGYEGHLLVRVRDDLQFFHRKTLGKRIICGRRTVAEFPGGLPLEGRENWVLTRSSVSSWPMARVFHSLAELREGLMAAELKETWIVGGGKVYAQLLAWCDEVWLTRFDAIFEKADCWFPILAVEDGWRLLEESSPRYEAGFTYRFCRYSREYRKVFSGMEDARCS